jgi:chromosome segregation ATPase
MDHDRNHDFGSGSVVFDRNYINPLFSSTEDLSSYETKNEELNKNIKTHIKELNTEISIIKSDIKEIKLCLESINDRMHNVSDSCNNMDRHISFIDGVYSTIRKPMEFIFNKISYISGSEPLVLEDTPKLD